MFFSESDSLDLAQKTCTKMFDKNITIVLNCNIKFECLFKNQTVDK